MPMTCGRCGAQNPDGNQFCSTCGLPLAAAVPAPPAAAPGWAAPPPPAAAPGPPPAAAPGPPPAAPGWAVAAPPVAAPPPPQAAPAWGVVPAPAPPAGYASPPGYTSPYYAPVGDTRQPPVHRTPWTIIIAAVVALVVVMAGCGTAVALLTNKVNITGGITADLPSPTPAGSPSPVASPSAFSGNTASNDYVTIPVLPNWQVVHKDSQVIALLSPSLLGSITVASGPLSPASTAQAGKDEIDKAISTKYPGAQNCAGTRPTNGTLNGASGIFWTLCYTVVQNGNSFPAASALFVGVSSNGSVAYLLELATLAGSMDSFRVETKPIVAGITWKHK
jgi:hypothetical protein